MSDTPEIPDTLPHTPIDPNQPAEPNLITWDCGAIYTSYDGSWGKTPRMIAYWNDIADDGSTRFLICNKSQELDSIQKEQALKNLGIQPATTTTFGLVRYTDNWQDTGSGDPGYWPVTLTRKAIIELCEHTIGEYSHTIDVEIYGKCADVYKQAEQAADLAVAASEAAEGFAGELRVKIVDVQTALAEHTGNTTMHMTDLEHDLVAGISAGRLWYPTATGAIITYGEQADGIAVVSQDLYTTVEVTNSGIVLQSINEPRWFNVRDMQYYNVLTAKTGATQDQISALLKRIEALENNRGTMHELYTGNGSDNANVKYMVLDQRYVQPYRLSSIQIMARGSGSGQERLYAVIYQQQIGGSSDPTTWERKDQSLSSVQQVDGRYNIWNFNNVPLAGDRPIAIVMTPVQDGGFDTPGHMGIWCFERDADDTVSKCIGVGSINYVPQLVMTSVEYNSEAVASISLADDDN